MSGTARLVGGSVVLVGLMLAGGCATPAYVAGYNFYPQPASVQVVQGATGQTPLTVLVTILGVRNPDEDHRIPYSVAVRMRFENNGPARITFEPRTLELTNGTLRPFAPPLVSPAAGQLVLEPQQRQEITAYFPFPPGTSAGNWNLSTLRLRWAVTVNGYPVQQNAYFERVGPGPGYYEYGPYY